MSIIQLNQALSGVLDRNIKELALLEHMSEAEIRTRIDQGSLTLLANPAHVNVRPTLIGQPARVKVNANIGTSPLASGMTEETDKLRVAETAGADAVMDLSTAGDLDAIRLRMLAETALPLGT
ncbi:MAG: phosphomethylpyrimidine synthase, partial [Desulfovibrio sp.]|nr:phosphomethylpyrimidine synthase [Desulfovibrio sp.]